MTLSPVPAQVVPITRPGTACATQLLRAFAQRGVRVAFGIPGAAISPVFDALAEVREIELVSTRHETAAVFAAIGHARATGIPAIVLVTSGPGVTNTLTGVACAASEEIPIIVIGGDVATTWAGRGALQDGSPAGLDVVALMRGATRWSASLYSPKMVAGVAARAWAAATDGPAGPVFLSVPYDVGQAVSEFDGVIVPATPERVCAPAISACVAAKELLVSAQRPLLVLGNGARKARAEAIRLVERLQMPVVVTSHAKGIFPEHHPLYLGLIGNACHPSAQEYIVSRPDVVCVAGSRLGDFATNAWAPPIRGRRATIQIDREPLLIGRNAPVTLGIVGDAALTLAAIDVACGDLARLPTVKSPSLRTFPWNDDCPEGKVKPQRVVEAMAEAFGDAIFCSDLGEHMNFAQHYLRVDHPNRFHIMAGFASMGSGLGAAIGIQHARPSERVVVFVGDGGFNMYASEVLTCAERGIGVVFVVFNDGCWNMVEHGFRAVYRRAPNHLPTNVADLAAVARGYGADGVVISKKEELDAQHLRSLVRPRRPLVLDVRVDPSECLSRMTRSAGLASLRAHLTRAQ